MVEENLLITGHVAGKNACRVSLARFLVGCNLPMGKEIELFIPQTLDYSSQLFHLILTPDLRRIS
jgi:hypothetical protein